MIEQLLAGESHATFMDDYFLKRPYSVAGGASSFRDIAQWPVVVRILEDLAADSMFVKDGKGADVSPHPGAPAARELFASGHTVLVRHAERHDAGVRALADAFQKDFAASVDVHIYCTPAGCTGFGWHYDAEDVFILQTNGVKEYQLRKNTVNPWPVRENLPQDMRYERELMPLMRCQLKEGDWLYIPHGYWHRATAEQDSISLAIGLMMPSPINLLPILQQFLIDSILWRQRFPVAGAAARSSRDLLREHFDATLQNLADELADSFRNPAFQSMAFESIFGRQDDPA
jgi:50S ribosomal protein L16 3-hydroxylase